MLILITTEGFVSCFVHITFILDLKVIGESQRGDLPCKLYHLSGCPCACAQYGPQCCVLDETQAYFAVL